MSRLRSLSRSTVRSLICFAVVSLSATAAFAHCQIPCGIYGDETRFVTLREHVTTIEKSMQQITEVGKAEAPNWNQLVRWVSNKDEHADALSEIVTYYFMAQRIKPPAADADDAAKAKYQTELGILHRMLVHSMKAKQTTDLEQVNELRALIDALETSYMGKNKGHGAGHSH